MNNIKIIENKPNVSETVKKYIENGLYKIFSKYVNKK